MMILNKVKAVLLTFVIARALHLFYIRGLTLIPGAVTVPYKADQNWWQRSLHNWTSLQRKWRVAENGCKRPLNCKGKFPFQNVLLAINFNHPHYHNAGILEWYYKPVFPHYIICGPGADPSGQLNIIVIQQPKEYGYYGFQCLVEAIHRNPGYEGYLYFNDDMIVNWWNLYSLDRTKIWFPAREFGKEKMKLPAKTTWWKRASCLERCIKAYSSLETDGNFAEMIDTYMKNVDNKRVCVNGLSDIVYIPGRLAKKYEAIGKVFYNHRLFLEVATPMALLMLDKKADFVKLNGVYLQLKYDSWGPWTGDTTRAWRNYSYMLHYLHPYKLTGQNRMKNTIEFVTRGINFSQTILMENCLDSLDKGSIL